MDEVKEKSLDNALLDQFDIDKYTKLSTGLVMVVQRQLLALAASTGTPMELMDREFLIEQLCKVEVTDAIRDRLKLPKK